MYTGTENIGDYMAGATALVLKGSCGYDTQTGHTVLSATSISVEETKYSQASARTMYSAMSMSPSR